MSDKSFIDSASLSGLREFLELRPQLQQLVGELARFRMVLDANMAIGDLLQKHKNPQLKQTALEECIRSSVLEVHAPTWLDREMTESTIPQVAKQKKISEPALQEMWCVYKQQLIWDERFSAPETSAETHGDVKDMPYVDLAQCISAVGILSRDKNIEQLGGRMLTLEFVFSVRTYARAASYHVSIHVGGTVISTMTIVGLSQIIKQVCSQISRLPDWAKLALFVVAVIVAMHPNSRERILNALQGTGAMIADLWPEVEKLLVLASEKQVEAKVALRESRELLES